MVNDEIIKQVMELIDSGEQINDVAKSVGIAPEVIRDNLSAWSRRYKSTRFFTNVETSLQPSDRLQEVLPKAMKNLEENDVEGFFEKIAPIAAAQMAQDAIMSGDEKIRHAAQKDILDRAGFKPKQQVEVYNKYDKLQRNELIAALRSALLDNPRSKQVLQLLPSRQDPDVFEAIDSPDNPTGTIDDDLVIAQEEEGELGLPADI